MECDKYTCKHTIETPHEIFDLIQGRTDFLKDIREKCIFRGINNDDYKLEPSSLRKNEYFLNKFIASTDMPLYKVDKEIIEKNAIPKGEYRKHNEEYYLRLNKEYTSPEGLEFDSSVLNQLQIRKELRVLMDFINYSDKSGLKPNINQRLRELIENPQVLNLRYWPEEDFYDVIALAQHYGAPTRFLDWSYDYNISIYFAVKDILNYNDKDYEKSNGVLWAFNYKLFDIQFQRNNSNEKFKLKFYRPAYYSNSNLHAQSGLFTFIVNNMITKDYKPLDDLIIDDFKKNTGNNPDINDRTHALSDNDIPEGEKIFYKFIIPPEFKPKILKELYLNNYSEEFLFPGYMGVTKSIENNEYFEKEINNRINELQALIDYLQIAHNFYTEYSVETTASIES